MDYLLHHLYFHSLNRVPDKEAISDDETTLTYSQLSEKAGFIAERLTQAGVRPGDRVAFFLDHNIHQAVSILGISAAGGAFVPVNALLFPEQVGHILRDSDSRVLITTKSRYDTLHEVLETCDDLTEVLLIDDQKGARHLERTCHVIENDLAAILYTSGSSGLPKGVMISHKNLTAGCWIISEYLNLRENDRLLGVLPLSFDYGLNQLITMLALGGTYRFLTFKYPNEIVEALSKYEITGFAGIPPIWAILVRSSLSRTPLPHLRYISNSGGAVPTTVLDLLKRYLPETDIVLMYGLTEAFRSTYLPPHELDKRPTSMGKAIPNTEIMVVSSDGKLCGPNEIGELVHRGPTVSLGYWKRPKDNAERFKPYPWDGSVEICNEKVVFSGDLVKTDEDGFLYFLGRNDGMIKCSGNRISPSEIEEEVFKTNLVKEAAAIGIPDEIAGQVIKVYIVRADEQKHSEDELTTMIIDFCSQHMPGYMVPRFIEIIDEMPKTATGKINYPELKKRNNS
ncbi:MAG: acyl-CoA ligase (AMP-forming), exosortase A system-associated [Sedimentisphaerales bacterium]|nr:acyl-CoA ligase (AMP-forming), exosortase A system-associated [Sedimentisphaerales bacterium]